MRTFKDGIRHQYDARGLLTAVIDTNGNTTAYAYDAQDRVVSITDPTGRATTFVYTGGRLASITDPAEVVRISAEHEVDFLPPEAND